MGAVGVVFPLRHRGIVVAMGRIDRLVVADHPAESCLHLLAILQQLDCHDQVGILGGLGILAQDEVVVVAGRRLEHREARGGFHPLGRARRDLGCDLDVPGQHGVQPRGLILDAEHLDLVQVGLAWLPVVRVAHADGAHARRELLQRERAGAVGLSEVGGAVLDDHEMRRAQDHRQVRVRCTQGDAHGAWPVGGDVLHLRGERPAGRSGLGVLDPVYRVDHVGRRQLRAVMERHARPQLEGPDLGALAGAEALGEFRLRHQLGIQPGQPVVEDEGPVVIRGLRAAAGIERVGGGGRLRRHPQLAAPLRRLGQRGAGNQPVGHRRAHAGGCQPSQQIPPPGAAAQRRLDQAPRFKHVVVVRHGAAFRVRWEEWRDYTTTWSWVFLLSRPIRRPIYQRHGGLVPTAADLSCSCAGASQIANRHAREGGYPRLHPPNISALEDVDTRLRGHDNVRLGVQSEAAPRFKWRLWGQTRP